MRRNNKIIILFILVSIVLFSAIFSIGQGRNNINQNINTITIESKIKIDINKATKAELMSIEGIGDKKSQLIINNRPYKSIWDLVNINGISENYIDK